MIISYSILGIPVSIYFLAVREVFTPPFNFAFWNILSACLICLFLIKKTQISINTIGGIGSFLLMLSMLSFSYGHKTFFHGSFYWFIPSIIMTMLFVGKRLAFLQMLIYLTTIILSHIFFTSDNLPIPDFWPRQGWIINLASDQIVSLLFSFITMFFFLLNKEKSERELHSAHEKIVEQQESMFQKSRLAELGEVAGGIAHEINNPLQVIAGNLQILKKEISRPDINREKVINKFEKLEETVDRISKIVNTMKNYSRDSSKEQSEEIVILDIIDELKAISLEKLNQRQIKFNIDLPTDLKVYGKRTQLFQVLLNLFNNACDAIENCVEKKISIVAKEFSDAVSITIIDSGPGIPKDIHDKVFQPFFTTKEFGKGTGLGLSISMKLVNDMHGELYVDSTLPSSAMTIVLPKGHLSI